MTDTAGAAGPEATAAEATAEEQPRPALPAATQLTLLPLTIVEEGEEFLVGNPARGEFVALPEIGVVVIRELQRGRTLGEAGALASRLAGEEVDVGDFAATLLDLGFVAEVDGVAVDAAPGGARPRRWIAGLRPELARPFFSPPLWVLYGSLFAACVALLLTQPRYRPAPSDFFFLDSPVVSVALLTVVAFLLGAVHEGCHWLSARAEGVAARFNVSRRLYFLAFETDLTQLWGVPRRQRFGPLLAGLAFDTLVLTTALAGRIAIRAGLWHPPAVVGRFLAALVLLEVTEMTMQFLVFMRTDLYAVLVVALGCRNLWRTNRLVVKRRLMRLSTEETAELAEAHQRDLRVARWYRWLYLAGLAWAGWYFVKFFLPATTTLLGWIADSLRADPGTAAFWQALLFGLLALLPTALTVGVVTWERLSRRRAAPG
jgi:hypothetical protein